VTVAQARVFSAEIDTIYAVQFAYVSYLYASAQNRLAERVRRRLDDKLLRDPFPSRGEDTRKEATTQKEAGADKLDALTLLAEGRREEALSGMERSLSLLREAMGLDAACPLTLAQTGLLDPQVPVDPEQAVRLALSRRPEIVQASLGNQVTDLEVGAQNARLLALRVGTFAAGSDIHANPLPGASFSPGYRPGAVGPEMPVTINGKRSDRVEQAQIYNDRAHSVLEKTQNLIRLETEQAFSRWKEARAKLAKFEKGIEKARRVLRYLRDKDPPLNLSALNHWLDTARLLTDLRFEENRARYDLLVALLALERATAGGFCAGLDQAPVVVEPAE
jgi:outer membrane protein TolC